MITTRHATLKADGCFRKIKMYQFVTILSVLWTAVESASYQRYEDTTRYPTYSTYSTLSNLYNQYPYKSGSYGNDIAPFPEVTRYPNYNPGLSTIDYNSYNTQRINNAYQPGYSTPGYNDMYGQGYSSYEMPFMKDIRDYCINRSPQHGIWVESLMGMWYGVEFIQHLAGDARVDYAKVCIIIHISEPKDRPSTENQLYHVQHINAKFRQDYRHLRLLWDEAGNTIEYALYFRNDTAGYWQVVGGQNGTFANRNNNPQFSGTIQVLKAVNDHLVLNFCQEPTSGRSAQLYSVMFSREPGVMARWEVDSVHNMLQNKKLSVASRRMVCGNSVGKPFTSVIILIFSCFLLYVRT